MASCGNLGWTGVLSCLLLCSLCAANAGCEPGGGLDGVSSADSELIGGTVDDTPPGGQAKFPWVVGVERRGANGGKGTGTVLSRRVVVTAGHLLKDITQGCEPFTYTAGAVDATGLPTPSRLLVRVADAKGCVYDDCGNTDDRTRYYVDAIARRPEYVPANVDHCCEEGYAGCCDVDPSGCDACNIPASDLPEDADAGVFIDYQNAFAPYDMVLLHLDRDIGVDPTLGQFDPPRFVAYLTDEEASEAVGGWPISPADWGNVTVTSVAATGADGAGGIGVRKYGLATVLGVGRHDENVQALTGASRCDSSLVLSGNAETAGFDCDLCSVNISLEATPLLPDGGPIGQPGDSGGPLIANYTDLGATAIDELPDGEPFVVGIGAPGSPAFNPMNATWNSVATIGDKLVEVKTGEFLMQHIRDWDGDGVPDASDNCVLAPNPEQDNCNEDAEQAKGFELRGDACDPIPCLAAELTSADGDVEAESCVETSFIVSCLGRRVRDRFDERPLGSHHRSSGAQNHRALPEILVAQVDSHYRFCQLNDTWGVDCAEGAINRSLLNLAPSVPNPARPWMPTSVSRTGYHPAWGATYSHEPFDYPSAGVQRRWHYFDDWSSWASSGMIEYPAECDPAAGCPSAPFGMGTSLDGRLWWHADTTKGTFNDPAWDSVSGSFAPATTGYHAIAGIPAAVEDVHLSNHYRWLAPDAPIESVAGKPVASKLPHWIVFHYLPFLPRTPYEAHSAWELRPGERAYLGEIEGGGFGLLRGDGRMLIDESELGSALRAELESGELVWASAVEPWRAVSRARADRAYSAVALAADGTDVVDAVRQQGTFIGATADFGAAAPGRPGSPSPRAQFKVVFSRAEDAVFVIGGSELATGELAGDIWMRAVQGPGPWRSLELGGLAVGRVLAATWSYLDQRLWVVDEVEEDGETQVRLYRVSPYSGAVDLAGAWARPGHFDEHWLVIDRDGQVLIASTSAKGKRHAFVRLEVRPDDPSAPMFLSFAVRGGALATAPLVDRFGYQLVLRGAHGLLRQERLEELHLVPNPHSSLATVF